MGKISNDKYYTSQELAKYCVKKTKEIIGEQNITEWLEPSGGNGVFLDFLPQGVYSCDIEPEDDRITKQDYLKLNLEYKKGRCVIGNPPFGTRNTLSVKFYKKSIQICDYISFILPISQLNNNIQMYEFDLVYSEDIGIREYSNRKIHCCINIFKRNDDGINSKPDYKLKDVTVLEYRRGGSYKIPKKYDYGMCTFGGSIGKELECEGQYCQESYFIINKLEIKDKVMNIIKSTDWKNLYSCVGTPKIQTWKIYKYLKEKIPELE